MPPAPRGATVSYGPRFRPGANRILGPDYTCPATDAIGSALLGTTARLHQHLQHVEVLLMRDGSALSGARLVRDDEIENGQHGDVLTYRAEAGVGAAVSARVPPAVPHPPEIAVAPWALAPARGVHLGNRRERLCDFVDPRARCHLPASPIAFAQHQVPDARHVARREVHVICEVLRSARVARFLMRGTIEILHAERLYEIRLERVVDVATRFFLENRAERVEVPVAVKIVRAGLLRSSRRRACEIVARVRGCM